MDIEWVLPAAKEAYQHRDEIQKAWQKILAILLGKKTKIAFTGMAGTGKTVLFDYLTDKAYKRGYKPPLPSQAVESGKMVTVERKRIAISVVPGQEAKPRYVATDQLFDKKKSTVDGIVHVVSNGFIHLRNTQAEKRLIESEYETLNSYCELMRKSVRKFGKPNWMIVAVTKVDLYYDSIEDVHQYYSPESDSRFVDRIQKLVSQVGSDNFRWDAAPVCAWLEDFEWNNIKTLSTLKPDQRDHYLASLASLLGNYCER